MRIGPVLRAYRKRKLKRMFPNGKITPHFRHIEFWTKDGTPIPIRAVPGLKKHINRWLEPMRAKFGPVTVMSGYRHEAYNRKIGGAKDSRHDWDKHPSATATDLIFAKGNPKLWAAELRRIRGSSVTGGIGTYPEQGFIHIDSGQRRDWSG